MPSRVVQSTQAAIVSLEGKEKILWEAESGVKGVGLIYLMVLHHTVS